MDVGDRLPGLVRSGRAELWLELRLPVQAARKSIFRHVLGTSPGQTRSDEVEVSGGEAIRRPR